LSIYDVVIIGAGIIGTTLARELSRYRLRVLVLEKEYDVSMGATKANSAIVHGGYAESRATLKGELCYPGRRQFEQLDRELHFGFDPIGSLVVTMEERREPLEQLLQQGKDNGVPDLEILDGNTVRAMEPNLNPGVQWALYCKGAGVCSPYEMAIAMAENAVNNGVDLRLEHEVQAVSSRGEGFVVQTSGGSFQGRFVVNCAGIYADRVSHMVGAGNFSIHPRSGEYLLFARGTGQGVNSVIFRLPTAMGKGVLVTSTYHGNLMIGPDASDDSPRDDTSTHMERIAAIYQQSRQLYDGMDPKKFLRSFTGIRARSSDNDFHIEESSVPGFFHAAGIQSPGLTAAPAATERLIKLLAKSGLTLEPDPGFNPHREPIITRKELRPFPEVKHLIDMPSAPEKIICRCEQVTEAEIVDSLHRGIRVKALDGVKRRTRASMGWCQGTFCRPRIAEVMEREYGEPVDNRFDIEHSGVSRVTRSDFLEFFQRRQ